MQTVLVFETHRSSLGESWGFYGLSLGRAWLPEVPGKALVSMWLCGGCGLSLAVGMVGEGVCPLPSSRFPDDRWRTWVCRTRLMSSFALFCGNKQISGRGFWRSRELPRGRAGGTGGSRKQAKTEGSAGGRASQAVGLETTGVLKPYSTLLSCEGKPDPHHALPLLPCRPSGKLTQARSVAQAGASKEEPAGCSTMENSRRAPGLARQGGSTSSLLLTGLWGPPRLGWG